MAEYIDREKLKEMIEAKADTLIEGKEAFLYVAKWIDLIKTEDVVPRREIEELKAKYEKQELWAKLLKAESYAPIIAKAKQEVASKLIDEISDFIWGSRGESFCLLVDGTFYGREETGGMRKVDCYYYDGESDCCGALSDYSKGLAGKEPCIDEKCKMREPTQAFECTAENCPLEFGKVGKCTVHNCEHRTKPQTNFDKITQSVESLAEAMVYEVWDNYYKRDFYRFLDEKVCDTKEEAIQIGIEWLQKESE